MTPVRRIARQSRNRLFLAELVRRGGRWLCVGASVGVVLVSLSKLVNLQGLGPSWLPEAGRFAWAWLLGVPVLVGIAVGTARALMARSNLLAAAGAVDTRLGLYDALSTGMALDDPRYAADPFATIARSSADAVATRVELRRAVPIRFSRSWILGASLVAASSAIGLLVPKSSWLMGDDPAIAQARAANVQAVQMELAEAVRVLRDSSVNPDEKSSADPAAPRAEQSQAQSNQIRALEELDQQLREGKIPVATAALQAARTLEDIAVQKSAEAARAREQQQSVIDRLRSAGTAGAAQAQSEKSDLAKALRSGDLADASRAAQELLRQDRPLSPLERKQAAQELAKLAEDLRKLDEPPEQLTPTLPEAAASPAGDAAQPSAPSSALNPPGDDPLRPSQNPAPSLSTAIAEAARELERPAPAPERTTPPPTELLEKADTSQLPRPEQTLDENRRPGTELPDSSQTSSLKPETESLKGQDTTPSGNDAANADGRRPASEPPTDSNTKADGQRTKEERPSSAPKADANPAGTDRATSQNPEGERSSQRDQEPPAESAKAADALKPKPGASSEGQGAEPEPPARDKSSGSSRANQESARPTAQSKTADGTKDSADPEAPESGQKITPKGKPSAQESSSESAEEQSSEKQKPTNGSSGASSPQTQQAKPKTGDESPQTQPSRSPNQRRSDSPKSGEQAPSPAQGTDTQVRVTPSKPENPTRSDQVQPSEPDARPKQSDKLPSTSESDQGTPETSKAKNNSRQPQEANGRDSSPTDEKSAIRRLADRLERMRQQSESAGQSARQQERSAEDLRQKAQEIAEHMSPAQRQQMQNWANAAARQQGQDNQQPERAKSASANGKPGSDGKDDASRAGTMPGQTSSDSNAPALPPTRTELVDARSDYPRSADVPPQVAAQWLATPDRTGQMSSADLQRAWSNSQRAAEKAVEDRRVPSRFDRLLGRYFRQLPTPSDTPASDGTPAAPILPSTPAKDAP